MTNQLKLKISTEFKYELDRKLRASLQLFPELEGERIEVGLTTTPFCLARAKTSLRDRIKICLNPHFPVTYFTLGHELTHFVQHLDEEETGTKIPYGEVQCDVWTLARHELFLDSVPCYLKVPIHISNDWWRYSNLVRKLCIEAIEIRKTKRQYMKWLEHQIIALDPTLTHKM